MGPKQLGASIANLNLLSINSGLQTAVFLSNHDGVREQWVYGSRNYLYFRDGIFESIQN
jgi:hypothetical protein